MIIENEGHQIYLWKLLGRIKFQELDEYELQEFVQSPFGTEILKELAKSSTNKFIPKDIGPVGQNVTDLILKRVDKWEKSSKETARHWDDKEIRNYLILMIEPYQYTDDLITRLTSEFKLRIRTK